MGDEAEEKPADAPAEDAPAEEAPAEEAPAPAPAEEAPAEVAPAEEAPPAAPSAEHIPAAPDQPPPATSTPRQSEIHLKSESALERKMSRVRVQEPESTEEHHEHNINRKYSVMIERSASNQMSTASLSRRLSRTASRRESEFCMSREALLNRKRSERFSRARLAMGSQISIRRSSLVGGEFGSGKSARYMNSYKLDSDNPFHIEKAEKILANVMTEALEGLTYEPDLCARKAKWASNAVRTQLKEMEFDRYKLVCLVTIGEKQSQDVHMACRFLWDVDRDKYATSVHENVHVFGVAMCFGIYYE